MSVFVGGFLYRCLNQTLLGAHQDVSFAAHFKRGVHGSRLIKHRYEYLDWCSTTLSAYSVPLVLDAQNVCARSNLPVDFL